MKQISIFLTIFALLCAPFLNSCGDDEPPYQPGNPSTTGGGNNGNNGGGNNGNNNGTGGNNDNPNNNAPGEELFTVNGVSFKMIKIEGGTFTMGATDYDWDYELAHQVTLSSYSIGVTEVTQELWQAVMGSNPSYFNGYGNSSSGSSHSADYGTNLQRPVEYVSWKSCHAFIEALNELTGKNFRLPTQSEWEYAGRGGNKSKGYKYSGSNNIENVAWFRDNSSGFTHKVGTKSPNELGLYDMSGNVCEWCQDILKLNGTVYGSMRVFCGGCWKYNAKDCKVSSWDASEQDVCNSRLGFRLAL